MISTFKKVKTEGIEIVDNLKYNFPDIDLKIDTNFQIDWIIIANSMSPIGDKKSSKDVNLIFNKFITERLHNGNSNYKILLTIIEGNDDEFFDIIEYLEQIEKIGFSDLRIIESKMTFTKMPKHEDKILLCKFYKTHTKFCTPYINSKSLLLELKKK
jgi:uncharacterized protein YqgV (UPF0045/DUF77 family)